MKFINEAYDNGFLAGQKDIIDNRILKEYTLPEIKNNSNEIIIDKSNYNDGDRNINNGNNENQNENDINIDEDINIQQDEQNQQDNQEDDNVNYKYLAVEKLKLSVNVSDPDVDPNDVVVDYDTVCRNYGNTMTVDVINNPITVLPGYKVAPSLENPDGVRYSSMRNVKFNLKDYGFTISAADLKYDSSSPGHFRIIVPNSNDIDNQGINYLGFQRLTYYLTGLKDASKVESNKIFPIEKNENGDVIVGGIIPYSYNGDSFEIIPDIIPNTDPVEDYESMEKVTTQLRLVDVNLPFKNLSQVSPLMGLYKLYNYLCSEVPVERDNINRIIPHSGIKDINFNLKKLQVKYKNSTTNNSGILTYNLTEREKTGFTELGVQVHPVIGFLDGVDIFIRNVNYSARIGEADSVNNNKVKVRRKNNSRDDINFIPVLNNKRLRGENTDPLSGEYGITIYDDVNKKYINFHKYSIEQENQFMYDMDEATMDDDNIGFQNVIQNTEIPIIDVVRTDPITTTGIFRYSISQYNNAYSLEPNSVNPYTNEFIGFDTIEVPVEINNKIVPGFGSTPNIYRPSDFDLDAIGFSSFQIIGTSNGSVNNLLDYEITSNSSLDENDQLIPYSIVNYNSENNTNYTGFDNIIVNVPPDINNYNPYPQNNPLIINNRNYNSSITFNSENYTGLDNIYIQAQIPSDVNNYSGYNSGSPYNIISNNGTISVPNSYTGLSNVEYIVNTVNINENNTINTRNGTYTVPNGSVGFNSFVVNVPSDVNNYNPYPENSPLLINSEGNGSISFDDSLYTGLNTIYYNVTVPLIQLEPNQSIDKNGEYQIYDYEKDNDLDIKLSSQQQRGLLMSRDVIDDPTFKNIGTFNVNVTPKLMDKVFTLSNIENSTTIYQGNDLLSELLYMPDLTSNNSNGFIVTIENNAIDSNSDAYKIFNDTINSSMYIAGKNSINSFWVLLECSELKKYNCIKLTTGYNNYFGQFELYGSIDNNTFELITNISDWLNTSSVVSIDNLNYRSYVHKFNNEIYYKYFKFVFIRASGTSNYLTIYRSILGDYNEFDGVKKVTIVNNTLSKIGAPQLGSYNTNNQTVNVTTSNVTNYPYCNRGDITVPLESKTVDVVNGSINSQTFTTSSGYYGMKSVVLNAINRSLVCTNITPDTSGVDASSVIVNQHIPDQGSRNLAILKLGQFVFSSSWSNSTGFYKCMIDNGGTWMTWETGTYSFYISSTLPVKINKIWTDSYGAQAGFYCSNDGQTWTTLISMRSYGSVVSNGFMTCVNENSWKWYKFSIYGNYDYCGFKQFKIYCCNEQSTNNSNALIENARTINMFENKNYYITPSEGYDGISEIIATVNVPSEVTNYQQYETDPIIINTNGERTIEIPFGYSGLGDVKLNINVNNYRLYNYGTITSNGTYTIPEDNDGIDSFTVDVPQLIIKDTYKPSNNSSYIDVNLVDSNVNGLDTEVVIDIPNNTDSNNTDINIIDIDGNIYPITSNYNGIVIRVKNNSSNGYTLYDGSNNVIGVTQGTVDKGRILGIDVKNSSGSSVGKYITVSNNGLVEEFELNTINNVTPIRSYYVPSRVTVGSLSQDEKDELKDMNGMYQLLNDDLVAIGSSDDIEEISNNAKSDFNVAQTLLNDNPNLSYNVYVCYYSMYNDAIGRDFTYHDYTVAYSMTSASDSSPSYGTSMVFNGNRYTFDGTDIGIYVERFVCWRIKVN